MKKMPTRPIVSRAFADSCVSACLYVLVFYLICIQNTYLCLCLACGGCVGLVVVCSGVCVKVLLRLVVGVCLRFVFVLRALVSSLSCPRLCLFICVCVLLVCLFICLFCLFVCLFVRSDVLHVLNTCWRAGVCSFAHDWDYGAHLCLRVLVLVFSRVSVCVCVLVWVVLAYVSVCVCVQLCVSDHVCLLVPMCVANLSVCV